MALLKSLIQRLLDSRTTPDEAANCAMPEGSKQDITPSIMSESIAWQRMHNGVAVDNGYIQAEGRGATAGKSQLMIGQDPNDFRSFSNTFEATGLNVCFAPVKKGQVYYVYGSNLTNLAIYFFKSVGNSAIVGGGYNRLVRRALSCLRPSFNFLLKNSLLVGVIGFLINPIRPLKRHTLRPRKQVIGLQLSLLVTDGFASRLMPHKFCLAMGKFGRVLHRQLLVTRAFQSQFQKVGQWRMCYHKTQQTRSPSLFQVSAINSFQTGGASC